MSLPISCLKLERWASTNRWKLFLALRQIILLVLSHYFCPFSGPGSRHRNGIDEVVSFLQLSRRHRDNKGKRRVKTSDIPMTRHFELLAKTLLARPELWISNISNALSLSSIESFGTNGCFETILCSFSIGGHTA